MELLTLGTVFLTRGGFFWIANFLDPDPPKRRNPSTFLVIVNTRKKNIESGFIRASLCGAVGWQARDTFPRSLHKVGLSGCNRIFSFFSPRTQIKVCSFHPTTMHWRSKDRERKLNSFFFFFFFTVKSGQNICLRAVVNFKTSCRQWQASVWTSVEIGFKPVDKTQSNGIEVRIICFGWDLHTFSSNLYTHLAMPPPHRCLNIRSCGELLLLLISQVLLSTFFNARKNTENLISSR